MQSPFNESWVAHILHSPPSLQDVLDEDGDEENGCGNGNPLWSDSQDSQSTLPSSQAAQDSPERPQGPNSAGGCNASSSPAPSACMNGRQPLQKITGAENRLTTTATKTSAASSADLRSTSACTVSGSKSPRTTGAHEISQTSAPKARRCVSAAFDEDLKHQIEMSGNWYDENNMLQQGELDDNSSTHSSFTDVWNQEYLNFVETDCDCAHRDDNSILSASRSGGVEESEYEYFVRRNDSGIAPDASVHPEETESHDSALETRWNPAPGRVSCANTEKPRKFDYVEEVAWDESKHSTTVNRSNGGFSCGSIRYQADTTDDSSSSGNSAEENYSLTTDSNPTLRFFDISHSLDSGSSTTTPVTVLMQKGQEDVSIPLPKKDTPSNKLLLPSPISVVVQLFTWIGQQPMKYQFENGATEVLHPHVAKPRINRKKNCIEFEIDRKKLPLSSDAGNFPFYFRVNVPYLGKAFASSAFKVCCSKKPRRLSLDYVPPRKSLSCSFCKRTVPPGMETDSTLEPVPSHLAQHRMKKGPDGKGKNERLNVLINLSEVSTTTLQKECCEGVLPNNEVHISIERDGLPTECVHSYNWETKTVEATIPRLEKAELHGSKLHLSISRKGKNTQSKRLPLSTRHGRSPFRLVVHLYPTHETLKSNRFVTTCSGQDEFIKPDLLETHEELRFLEGFLPREKTKGSRRR
eukprot:gb/GECG01001221.1/.p1 GENE.gb/GECG01001221.1/~~gb/GECG01001221.1/.p1  ORF type:complete len:693 (+),score=74.70 gb/GECG01001221.1/:1-2079(+)